MVSWMKADPRGVQTGLRLGKESKGGGVRVEEVGCDEGGEAACEDGEVDHDGERELSTFRPSAQIEKGNCWLGLTHIYLPVL